MAVDIKRAATALSQSDLLQDLGERQLAMMASAGKRRSHKRYTAVYREASPATCFYVLKSGMLHETSPGGVDRYLSASGGPESPFVLFGMESLLGRPRASTVVAHTDAFVLKFSAVDLNVREDGAAKVAQKVFNAFVEAELCHMSLFQGVPSKLLKQVVPLFALEEIRAGTTIFGMGSPGDKVFVVMHGSVQIVKGSLTLQTLHAEQGQAATSDIGLPVFGEMAMLDRKPRTASAVAVSDCKLLVLPHEQFAACMLIMPDIKARLRKMKEMRKKENAANEKERSRQTALAEKEERAGEEAKAAEARRAQLGAG